MINRQMLRRRETKIFLIALMFLGILLLTALFDSNFRALPKIGRNSLTLVKSARVPVTEISGMHFNHKTQNLTVIGDTNCTVMEAQVLGTRLGEMRSASCASALIQRFSPCPEGSTFVGCQDLAKNLASQWEGVTRDRAGRYFLLHEQLSSVFVLNADLSYSHVLQLASFSSSSLPLRGKTTEEHRNALAEGIALAQDGHFFIAKERFPPTLVEYALDKTVTSLGLTPEAFLRDGVFQLPAASDRGLYYAIKRWRLPSEYGSCDISELAADARGRLYILSQQCNWIAELDIVDNDSEELAFSGLWEMPTSLQFVEALAVVDEQTFIVGSDRKSPQLDNIFFLRKRAVSEAVASE